MLKFEKFSLEALKKVLPYIKKCPYLCNDLSVGSLFMWHEGADVQFCIWHDTFLIRQNIGEQPAFSFPFGADPAGMLEELIKYVCQNSLPLRFFAVDEERLSVIQNDKRLQPVMSACDVRWSDYIYSFEEAATFQGKKFSGQRNHINKFKKLYGEPVVRPLQKDDRALLEVMLAEYEKEHPDGNALEKKELEQAKKLLDVREELDLPAACLLVGNEIAAFSVGEIIGDMLIIHVEKALKRFEGSYPTMYQGFVRLIGESLGRPLKIVNMEDDSGDPGLRTSKRQYQPIGMVDKYLVHVNSPAAQIMEMPVLHAGEIVLTKMRESDKAAYYTMNTDIENNRFWGYDYREDMNITQMDENIFYDSVQYDMRAGDSINFAIRLSENGEMIGEGILWQFTSDGSVELGCRLRPEYFGRGYGRAAFGALAKFAEETLGLKAVARCYSQNLPSYKMIMDNGFVITGQDEQFYYFERKKAVRHRQCS